MVRIPLNLPGAYATSELPEFLSPEIAARVTTRITPVLSGLPSRNRHRVDSDVSTENNWAGGVVWKNLINLQPTADTPLVGYATGWNSQQHVIMICAFSGDRHIWDLMCDASWHSVDVSAASSTPATAMPAVGSPLAGYTTDWLKQQHIVYVDDVGHIHELMYDTQWHHRDLTADSSVPGQPATPPAKPGSPLVAYASGWNQQQHFIYVAVDSMGGSDVHELVCDSTWHHNKLTEIHVVSGGIAGYTSDWMQQQHINWTAAEAYFDVLELMYDGTQWNSVNLTTNSTTPTGGKTSPSFGGSPFVGYTSGWNKQQHVLFVDGDGDRHLWELMCDSTWHSRDLTADAASHGDVVPAVYGAIAGYTTDWNQQQHAVFVGDDQRIYELMYDGVWHGRDLTTAANTAKAATPLATGNSPLIGYATAWNNQQHVIFVGVDGNLYELMYDSSWHFTDLSDAVKRPATPWTTASGQWTVPSVSRPSWPLGSSSTWMSCSWIGIDGQGLINDVLQAGVEQDVDDSGNPNYHAWYEWFAPSADGSPKYRDQTKIDNFEVQPGHVIYCALQYINNNSAGRIFLLNTTTGQHCTIDLDPPIGATFNGASVEWIVEATAAGDDASQQAIPVFTPVTFTECEGFDALKTIANPKDGDITEINDGTRQMTNTTLSDRTVNVDCAWNHNVLNTEAKPDSPLTSYVSNWNRQQHVIYIDNTAFESHIYELMCDSAWHANDLTAATTATGDTAPPPALASPFSGYTTEWNQQQHIAYIGDNGDIHELVYDNDWRHHDLTSDIKSQSGQAPTADTDSPLVGYATDWNQQQHIIVTQTVGADRHVWELMYDGTWVGRDLTSDPTLAGQNTPAAAPDSKLAGYTTEWNQQQHIIFTDKLGNIHELLYGNGWQHHNLTSDSSTTAGVSTPTAKTGGPLIGYATAWNNQQHIIFVDDVGEIHELMYDTTWHHTNLSQQIGTTFLVVGDKLVAYGCGANEQQYVLFSSTGNHIHLYAYDNGWYQSDLTPSLAKTSLPMPDGWLSAYTSEWNHQQHLNYIGADFDVHELVL
jgi:hypothetical protein